MNSRQLYESLTIESWEQNPPLWLWPAGILGFLVAALTNCVQNNWRGSNTKRGAD